CHWDLLVRHWVC
nr:Chain G, BR3 derived PEPTIDE [synthetic construct]1OSG_H Chain H, BR3 derived PEPTIDE [synthetic construct]1OSG_I Chain I, BR3 derived PEPTIDE [synthetic construct]1OSG_J Chain J, BR3 derived PEPTIDE [synthetic construct]1OSG_K Chain K, BR3 derived PEPTIDE [synthetic construct]1OSG_L Chain L, BR3 derived PEPTIDE [synthetic construct]